MSFPGLERCPHGEYRDHACQQCVHQDMIDALRQWAAAERDGDEVELNNARRARDRVLVALDPLEIGAVYRTPYRESGLFRVLEIEPQGNGHGATARGVFVGDHPAGYPDGSPGRYFVKELIGRKVTPCS